MENGLILYPCYFDASIERSDGRRVSIKSGVKKPVLSDIQAALKRCSLEFEVQDKSHPAHWWEKDGRVVVKFEGKKSELIQKVVENISVDPKRLKKQVKKGRK